MVVALVATLAVWAVIPVAAQVAAARTTPAAPCHVGPVGAGEGMADALVKRYLHTVVVHDASRPTKACEGRLLAVAGLAPVRYETRIPVRVQGWYQLAPRIRNAKGLWEYAVFLWIDAPDAKPAAFELLLELHGDRWLVSSIRRAPGSAEIDLSKLPT
jgi:hypothetical protein